MSIYFPLWCTGSETLRESCPGPGPHRGALSWHRLAGNPRGVIREGSLLQQTAWPVRFMVLLHPLNVTKNHFQSWCLRNIVVV